MIQKMLFLHGYLSDSDCSNFTMSAIHIVVILLNAIIKVLVGMKRETNDGSAIADSLHKKEKHVTYCDVFCLRTTNNFLKKVVK